MSGQVVELRIWETPRVSRAVSRVAISRLQLRRISGLRFAKLLGTGSGETFTMRDADPHHWALLTVWDDGHAADAGAASTAIGGWSEVSTTELRVRMTPLATKGRWSRREPFLIDDPSRKREWDGPVAAITRARLRPTRALSFWRAVPPVVADLTGSDGLRLAVGIGESPIGLQGTFSLWENAAALTDFAYRSPAHANAIRETRPQRWYAEDLFARLAVLDVEGTYTGVRP